MLDADNFIFVDLGGVKIKVILHIFAKRQGSLSVIFWKNVGA